tara:strand:- start:451 stop:1185 length:735 start_codon:yes stop_codon:yes gene_type:complete
MFILYYNNINYTINTFKYNLYPKTFLPLELSNNDKKILICNSKSRNKRYKNKDPFIVTSGELLLTKNNKFIIDTYNFRMVLLPTLTTLKENIDIIKLNKYIIDINLEFNNWIVNNNNSPDWSGITLFFNYIDSNNTNTFSIRKDGLVVIKQKYKKKYKTLYKKKISNLFIKSNIFDICLSIDTSSITQKHILKSKIIILNSKSKEMENEYFFEYSPENPFNLSNGSVGLRLDYVHMNLNYFKIS